MRYFYEFIKVLKIIDELNESYIIAYENLTSYKSSNTYIKKIVFFFDKVNSKHPIS
jgi:hypothetical protein